MDPATIAASVAALLAPYLKKAGEDFVGDAGKYVQERAKGLWEKIRAKLDGEPQSKIALDRFEKDPVAHSDEFKATIEKKVEADQTLSKEIADDVAEIKRKAPYLRVVQEMKDAEDVVGARVKRMKAGTVDVTQNIDKATKVTGADIDEMG
jgi:hypothetical protein